MGFKIGKFFGRIGSGLIRSVPAAVAGFAGGGPAGAGLALLGNTTFGTGPNTAPTGSNAMFDAAATFGPTAIPVRASTGVPMAPMVPRPGASSMAVQIPQSVFQSITVLAGKLGIPIRSVQAIVPIGKRILARLVRFARLTPGMNLVGVLISLGLAVTAANELVTWFATSGRRRRRIRVTNVKALNRSVRRLEGFRRLSHRVEAALARRSVGRLSAARARRCPKCRKNPCTC